MQTEGESVKDGRARTGLDTSFEAVFLTVMPLRIVNWL